MFDGRAELVFNIYMERKLVQIGKSLAVTLPVEVVKDLKLEKGQTVDVSVHPLTGAVTIRGGAKYFDAGKCHKAVPRAHSSSAGKTQ